MKNSRKKKTIVLLILWTLVFIFIPAFILWLQDTLSSKNSSYISSAFDIDDYNVILDVDDDNKVDVTENVTVNIPNSEYKGIYRSIPLWEESSDNKKRKVEITNLRVIGEKFELDKFNDKMGIRAGSTRTYTEEGEHTYTIKYRYNMGKDSNYGYDEFVFNLFGNYDNTKINNMHVMVNMPKAFGNNIKFYKEGVDVTKDITYKIANNSIDITLSDYTLDSSLMLLIILPDGYFVSGTYNYGVISLIICLFIIGASIYSVIRLKKYSNKSLHRVSSAELFAPDDLDPAEIGYICGETNVRKLTTALIISLASKGYISIKKTENNKDNIVNTGINKEKLPKLSILEQTVYLELFKNGNSNVLSEDRGFVSIFGKISSILENVIDKKINNSNVKKVMNSTFYLLFASAILWIVTYMFINDLDPRFNILYLLSFVSIYATGIISIFINEKTNYGEVILARVKGFKDYLMTAEKNQLDSMAERTPNYFYDILPYAYVLNVSDRWIKLFEKHNVLNINLDALNNYENNLFMVIE